MPRKKLSDLRVRYLYERITAHRTKQMVRTLKRLFDESDGEQGTFFINDVLWHRLEKEVDPPPDRGPFEMDKIRLVVSPHVPQFDEDKIECVWCFPTWVGSALFQSPNWPVPLARSPFDADLVEEE